MNRRNFLVRLASKVAIAVAAVAGAGRFLTACGVATEDGACSGTVSTFSGHTHSLSTSVSEDDVTAAADKSYTLSTTGGHNHTVTVTAANFATLAAGSPVTITSVADGTGHSHNVTVTC